MTLTLLLYSLILFSKREKDHAEYHTLMNYDCKGVTQIYQTKATCHCHNIKLIISISFKVRQFLLCFFWPVFALSCSLHNAIVYLSCVVMLLCITKLLNHVI